MSTEHSEPQVNTDGESSPEFSPNSGNAPATSKTESSVPIKRRNRMPLACTVCRKRKVKCDRSRPACKVCIQYRVTHLCHYEQPTWANSSKSDKSPPNRVSPQDSSAISEGHPKRTKISNEYSNNNNNTINYAQSPPNSTTVQNSSTYPFANNFESPQDVLNRSMSNERSFVNPVNKPQAPIGYNGMGINKNDQQQMGDNNLNNKPVMNELQLLKEKIKQIEASISVSDTATANVQHQQQQTALPYPHSQGQQQNTAMNPLPHSLPQPRSHLIDGSQLFSNPGFTPNSTISQKFQLPSLLGNNNDDYNSNSKKSIGSNNHPFDPESGSRRISASSLTPLQSWKSNQSPLPPYYQYQASSPSASSILNSNSKNYSTLPPLVPFPITTPSVSNLSDTQKPINSSQSTSPPPFLQGPKQQSNVLPPLPPLPHHAPQPLAFANYDESSRAGVQMQSNVRRDSNQSPPAIPATPLSMTDDKNSALFGSQSFDTSKAASVNSSNFSEDNMREYLSEKFKHINVDPNDVLNLQEGYAPIHARESRVKNHGPLSWITLLKKDPYLKMMWFKLLEFKKSQKIKLIQIQRKGNTKGDVDSTAVGTQLSFRNRLLEQEGIADMQPYDHKDTNCDDFDPHAIGIAVPKESDERSSPKVEEGIESTKEKKEEENPNDSQNGSPTKAQTESEAVTGKETEAEEKMRKKDAFETKFAIEQAKAEVKAAETLRKITGGNSELFDKSVVRDKDSVAMINIPKVLPKRKVIWLLLDHFFKYVYLYFPYVDQELFTSDIENLIGARSYEDEPVKSIHIPRRLEFANIGLLLVILRISYLSLLQNYASKYIPKKSEDEEYLLRHPIETEIITVAQLCLNQFKLISTCSLSIFQCTLFMRIYNGYAPEESDIGDNADSQIFTGILVQMATVIGLNRDPSIFSSGNISPKVANLWRKLWYCLVDLDNAQSVSMCNPRMIDSDFYDTKLPEFSPEACNVEDQEVERNVITSIRNQFELNSKMVGITKSILNIRNPPTIFTLAEQIFSIETALNRNTSIMDLLTPASQNPIENMLKLKKLIAHFQCYTLIHSLFYHIFLHYDFKGNILACRFIAEKMLNIMIQVISVFNELLMFGPKYFGPYCDAFLTRCLESSMHKCLHFQLSLFSRCLVFMQSKKQEGDTEENKALIEAIKSIMDGCILVNVQNYVNGLSLVSERYYHAWRMSKAQNFILFLIRDHDFIMNEFNKLAMSDQKGTRIIPKLSLFEGFTVKDFEKIRDILNVDVFLKRHGITIVNGEFSFSHADNTHKNQWQNMKKYQSDDSSAVDSSQSSSSPTQNESEATSNNQDPPLYAPNKKSSADVDNFWLDLMNKRQSVDPIFNRGEYEFTQEQPTNDGSDMFYKIDADALNNANIDIIGNINGQYGSPSAVAGNYDDFWFQNEIDVDEFPGYGVVDTEFILKT